MLISIFTVMFHFVVSQLSGNSHTGLLLDAMGTDFAAWSAAKPSVAYGETIVYAGKFILLL
jgi:hypothetical protein